MFELTFTHLDTEKEYRSVYRELYGEDDPSPFDPHWSHSLSRTVSASELGSLVAMIATMTPTLELWQMRIEKVEG